MREFFFQFQNNIALTSKNKEVSLTDTSPYTTRESVPCISSKQLLLDSKFIDGVDSRLQRLDVVLQRRRLLQLRLQRRRVRRRRFLRLQESLNLVHPEEKRVIGPFIEKIIHLN